jgi:hypothetical protein
MFDRRDNVFVMASRFKRKNLTRSFLFLRCDSANQCTAKILKYCILKGRNRVSLCEYDAELSIPSTQKAGCPAHRTTRLKDCNLFGFRAFMED